MKNCNIQVYGQVEDSFPEGVTWASVAFEDQFGVNEELKGDWLEVVPDLCLEIHTRPYYAHLMPEGVPKAVIFRNFPDGYFHNEAILDLYDYVFYDDILGENYSRFHSGCHFLPPWMPDGFLLGEGEYREGDGTVVLGADADPTTGRSWSFEDLKITLRGYNSLGGRWFLGYSGYKELPLSFAVCFKADNVYVRNQSPFHRLGREIGAGLFTDRNDSLEIIQEQKDRGFRQDQIVENHLFRKRMEQILSLCFTDHNGAQTSS